MLAHRTIGYALLLIVFGLPFHLQAFSEEYKTDFADVFQARNAGWEAIRGKLSKLQAPELSAVNDAAVGKTALRVEAKYEGEWQGIALEDSIDLRELAGMEFYIKQNVRTTSPEWACAVQIFFEGDGYALANPKMGKGEWTKVYLPFQTPPWQLENRPEGWGKTRRIRFYPYRELDTPGEFIMIDGLRFVSKSEDPTAATQGITYRYETPPEQGSDDNHTILLDRKVEKKNPVTWPPYTDDPTIVFDLGEEQTLTKVTLEAYAGPAQNIASAAIDVSANGEQWTPAGSIANDSAVRAVGEQRLAPVCFGVGRYVRITLKRPRVDVRVVLGEVVLDRHVTTQADREVRRGVYFEGPKMPPIPADMIDSEEYAFLRGEKIIVAVHRKTGIIGGLWTTAKERILLRGWDRYVFENRDALVESSEYSDSCRQINATKDSLIIEGVNNDLPDLTIRKEYRLAANNREEWLKKLTTFKYIGKRPDQFVTLLTNAALDEAFRRGGYYEGAQVRCDRTLADKVYLKRVVPPTKSVMLVRPGSLETITQYRHKVNGRFCTPYYGQNPMEAYNSTSYNRCGWEIGHSTIKLSDEKIASTEVHTAVLDGGRFGWEGHYVSLPDYKQYVAELSRPAWMNDIKGIMLDSYKCVLWGQTERTAKRLVQIFDDGYIVAPALTHLDGVWGELPISGNAIGLFGGITPTGDIARMFRSLKEIPRYKAGLYMWLTSVNKEAKVFQDHPEWFTATNKDGEPRVIFPQLKANFGRIMSIPEHRDFVVGQVATLHERYPQDVWYLDGGNTAVNMIDWQSLRISQDYDGQDFCRRVRSKVKEINPDCIAFFNGADERIADIGFAEIGRRFGKEWRRAAARMYSCKVRQYFDPNRLMSPLYWIGPGNVYLRICVALGYPPSGPTGLYTPILLSYAPYCAAAFETRGLQFSPTQYTPNWREDEETLIEIYALRAGRALVLSVISHRKDELSQKIAAEVPADVAIPGETVYVSHHVMKHIGEYKIPNSDFANKDAYRKTGWATDAVTELRSIQPVKVDESGWINLTAPLPPDLLNLFSIVKTPVYFWSRNDMRANFLLPSVRKLHTATKVNGDTLTVTVTPDDVPRELLVLAPRSKYVSHPSVNGKEVACREVALRGLLGQIVAIPPSKREVKTAFRFAESPKTQGKIELALLSEVKAGGTLDVNVKSAPSGPLCCNIWRAATLVYAGSSSERTISLPAPVQAHNGDYVIEVVSRAGPRGMGAFHLSGHQATDNIPRDAPVIKRNLDITPVNVKRDGVTILSKGAFEVGRCRPSVSIEDMTVRTEMPKECVTYYAQCMAGIELKGIRAAAIRVGHNMYPVRGLYPERHVLYETKTNAFIGFFIDYATPKGYVKRVALSVGKMNPKRNSKLPEWGAKKAPDHYLRLPSTIYTGEKVEGMLDLTTWAPAGWDGRVWISVVMDLALPSRWLGMTLVKVNPPAGSIPAIKIEDVSGTVDRMKNRRIRAVRFTKPPKLDGDLEDAVWKQAKPEQGLVVVAKQGEPASQQTEVRLGYDDNFLYVGMAAWESEKKGFDTTNGAAGRPWWDDAIEFAFAPTAWQGEFLHQIVSADAVIYQEIATNVQEKRRKSSMLVICKAQKYPDRFTVEAAVPLGPDGLPAPKAGEEWKAQFMRTRVMLNGSREHATWTVTDSFHDYTRFGAVVFE